MNAFACGKSPAFPIASLVFLLSLCPVRAKVAISILGTWVEGRDTAFCAGLSREMGQILAEDTSLLVYDLRKKHGPALDSAQARGALLDPAVLASLSGSRIKWGLAMVCTESREEYACAIEAADMAEAGNRMIDTLRVLPEAGEKRRLFGQAAAGRIRSLLFPDLAGVPVLGAIRFRTPVNPGMVIRGVTVVSKGTISEVPLGATLVIGDAPGPFLAGMDGVHYVFYPQSSYTYILPRVVQLNHGSLGIVKGADSSSMEAGNRQPPAKDNSETIWKTLSKVAALDSGNLIWKSLSQAASPDSMGTFLRNLQKTAFLKGEGPLRGAVEMFSTLDGAGTLLRTLGQVAAMDSSNLVWKSLGQVSALDSTNPIWRKLGEIGSLDSNSIWRKLGLLAFQESTVVLTPSFIARGEAQAVLFRHEGSVSTVEAIKAGMTVRPLLSSQEAVPVAAMRVARTRGYSLKQERLASYRADRILREFAAVNAGRDSRTFSKFLPGKLFSSGTALRTAGRPVQAFIASGFRELDMEVGLLSPEKEVWSEFGSTFRAGSHESGCYLCSPDRLGP